MKSFFRVIRNNWVDLILLNLAFLLGCIPIVTIPASMAALCNAILRMQQEQEVRAFSDFFRDVRENFLHSLPIGGILLAGLILGLIGWHILMQTGADQKRFALMVPLFLWFYFVFSFGMYAIPLNAYTTLSYRTVFRDALILTLARGWQNIAALLLVGMCTVLLAITFPFLLPVALFAHFSFCALISNCFAWAGLRQCFAT